MFDLIFETIKKKNVRFLLLIFFINTLGSSAQTITGSINAPDAVCEGTDVSFIAAVTGAINLEFQFSMDGTIVQPFSSVTSYGQKMTQPGIFEITVQVRSTSDPLISGEFKKKIEVVAIPVANAGDDVTICFGTFTRIGTPNVQSGVTYSWTPANRVDDASAARPMTTALVNNANNLFTLRVTSNRLATCFSTDEVTVITRPAPNVGNANYFGGGNQGVCNGTTKRMAGAVLEGVNYEWTSTPGGLFDNNTLPNPTAKPVPDIPYWVTVTLTRSDLEGCSTTYGLAITPWANPPVNAGGDKQICRGSSVQLGGAPTGNVSYFWSPNMVDNPAISNPTTIGLNASTQFVVTATYNNTGCSSRDTANIEVTKEAEINYQLTGWGEYCEGGSTSGNYIELSGSEKTAQYALYRNGSQDKAWLQGTGSKLRWDNLIGGQYTVIARNEIGCEREIPGRVIITEFKLPTATITALRDSICSGQQDPELRIDFTGTPPFEFIIQDPFGQKKLYAESTTYTINEKIFSNQPNVFTWTIKEITSADGCKNTFGNNPPEATVRVDVVPRAKIDGDAIVLPVCARDPLELSVIGGNPSSESYRWNTGEEGSHIIVAPSVDTDYILTATNTNNRRCFSRDTFRVKVKPLDEVIITGLNDDRLYCSNDKPVTLFASPAGGTFSGTGVNSILNQFNPSLVFSGASTISYTVMGSNQCSTTGSVDVWVNIVPPTNFTVSAKPFVGDAPPYENSYNVCLPDNGELFLQGTPPINGVWTFREQGQGATVLDTTRSGTPRGGAYLTNCVPGTYTLEYAHTDSKGCIGREEKTIFVADEAPNPIYMGDLFRRDKNGFTVGDTMCITSQYAEIWVEGTTDAATGKFSINPANLIVSEDPAQGLLIIDPSKAPSQNRYRISYSMVDANQCTHSTSKNFYINSPINIRSEGLQANYCETDDKVEFVYIAHIEVTGKVTIIKNKVDTVGLHYSIKSGDFIPFYPSQGVGQYEIFYEYFDGVCDNINIQNVTVNPTPIVKLTLPESVCYGDGIPLSAIPPGGSYTYGAHRTPVAGFIDTKEIGVGIVTVYYDREVLGCRGSDSTIVKILGVANFGVRQKCTTGDEKIVFLTGSEMGTTYILYADNVPYDTVQGTGGEVQFEKTLSTYAHCYVWAEGANGCKMRLTDEVTIRPLDVKLAKTDISCHGRADGTAFAVVSGGILPYDFMWSYPGGDIVRDSVRKSLNPGIYYFTVKDSVGCLYRDTIEIIEPELLEVTFGNINEPKCAGENNGSIDAIVSGGTFSFDYLWVVLPERDTVATTASLINVGHGTYEVHVTDRNGCTANNRVDFTQNSPLAITVDNVVHNTIFGEEKGEIDITVTGGEEPFHYLWRGIGITPANENNKDLTNLPAGNYFLLVTDNNDCMTDTMVVVKQPEELLVDVIITPVNCNGGKTGSITLNIYGGQEEYKVAWTGANGFSSATQSIGNLVAGIYHVTVTDANGKSYRNSYEVTEPRKLQINTLPRTNLTLRCNMDSTAIIEISVGGGVTPYQIEWISSSIPFENTNLTMFENLPADNYLVRVTDFNDCTVEQKYEIRQPTKIDARSSIGNISCAGRNDGSILLNPVTGGTPPYSYFWTGGNSIANRRDQTGLIPDTYYVEIQDANNCIKQDSFIIRPVIQSTVKMSIPETFCSENEFVELRFDFTGTPFWNVAFTDGTIPNYVRTALSPYFVKVAPDKNTTYRIISATDGRTSASAPNGCPVEYSNLGVDIVMAPSPILTLINAPEDICLGDSFEVEFLLQQGPVWSIAYNDNGGVRIINNITDANYKLKIATNRPGRHTYEIISISNGRCNTLVNIPFAVNARNYPEIAATPPNKVCAGQQFVTKLNFIGDGPWTVDYHLGDFIRTDSFFNAVSYIEDVLFKNTAYQFNTVTSKYGCTTEIDRKINVEVNPLPDDAFTITGASAVCLGESDYSTPFIGNTNSYHWTLPEGVEFVSGNETNTIKVRFTEKAKAGLISVQGRNDCGLGVAASIFVTAPKIIGKAGVINSKLEICRGATEPIVISTTLIENADRYIWLLPPGFNITFGEYSSSIMVTTQRTAQSGVVKVWGENHCSNSDTISLRINILEAPIVVAGADRTIGCNEENRTRLEALNPAPASGQWRLMWGSGIIADIYNPRSEVVGLALGRNVFRWEVSDGKCASADSVIISNMNVDLTNPAFSETVTCMDSMALKAGKPRQGTGEWSLVGGGGTLEQTSETEAMVRDLEMGTNFFRWRVFNEYCSRDTVIRVTSNNPKKYAFAGENDTVFMPASVLNARIPGAGVTGEWSIIGGSSVLDNVSNPRSIVRNLSAGLNTFRWTVTYKGCAEFDEVIIFYGTGIVDGKEDFIIFPNAFTPNPVASNGGRYTLEIHIPNYRDTDVFYPIWYGVEMKGYALQIFNRWGQMIFQSNNIDRGWDGYINGELAPQGTYIYKASGVFSNGKTFIKTGEISLFH